MRQYQNPDQYMRTALQRAAEREAKNLEQAAIAPNETLTEALTERALEEAYDSYVRDALEVRDHNIGVILQDHHRRMNAVKREGATMRWWMCPLLSLVFAILAWYSFAQATSSSVVLGWLYSVGSLAFLAMLVLGAVFDRLRQE